MMLAVLLTTLAAAVSIWAAVCLGSVGLSAYALYYRAFWHILVTRGSYDDLRKMCGAPRIGFQSKQDQREMTMTTSEEQKLFKAVWLHTLALNMKLWSEPHYRADSLRHDLVANFSNIAFPGTGIPMSWVCCSKMVAIMYLLVCHPWVILAASLVISRSTLHRRGRTFGEIFEEELLAPKHWFALWRINSTLVAAHHNAHAHAPKIQNEYRYENKWDFLELALQQEKASSAVQFKVTPIITKVAEMVCKHKNIEGGMGIHMFKNAVHGGDWILQERLYNCAELQALLPADAPLSTFRVITMVDPTAETVESSHCAMTFVFRAGRAGKDTDHSSILFAVNPDTLQIQDGKMFSNWYQVGKTGSSNLLSKQEIEVHPDTKENLTGKELTCAQDAVKMCVEAHKSLMPHVPTIGWDVAVADGQGAVLLEANLSCNFFGGVYDRQKYLKILDTYFANDCRPEMGA
jgi:hypothetical protein